MYTQDSFGRIEAFIGTDVATNGTFVFNYPSGTTQDSYNTGLAGPNTYVTIDDNDSYSAANPSTGITIVYGASNITVTNKSASTWKAGSKITLQADMRDGNLVEIISLPIDLTAITANGDVITEMRPGIAGTIEYIEYVNIKAPTTAAKLATLNVEIGTVDVTGAPLALTSANLATRGVVIGAVPTGNNVLKKESKLSIEATGVTAFVEGSGVLNLRIRRG